jgi:hypothetical protein
MAVAEKLDFYGTADAFPADSQDSKVSYETRLGPNVVAGAEAVSSKLSTPGDLAGVVESSAEIGKVHVVRPEYSDKKASEWESIVQTWEGRVIHDDPAAQEFIAIIRDLTCRSNPDEEVVIGYESVLPSDLPLISGGAVFFWNIGRYRKYSVSGKIGPSKHKYEIRFRRLPPMSAERLAEISKQSKELSERLHGNHPA